MNETVKKENRLLASTLFTFSVSGAASLLMGNLMPFLRGEYGINYLQAGLLLSLPSWGNLVSLLITGYLPTYIGRRKTILLTSVWMATAFVLLTFGIGGAVVLPAVCVMIGVSRGGNSNFSNTMISTLSGSRTAAGYNLLHGAFAFGAVLSPVLLVLCTRSNPGGWRIMTGGISLLCIAQILVYARMALPQEQITGSIRSVDLTFLKNRGFWVGTAILFFYISAEYAIVNWLVTYFKDSGILSSHTAQLMSSLLWIVIFIGRTLGAATASRISRKTLLVTDGMGFLAFFLLVFFSRSEVPIFLGIMGIGLFMSTIYTTALTLGTESIRGNDVGISSMVFLGTIGGIITPALVGMVAEKAGIQAGMGVVIAVTVLLLGTILLSVYCEKNSQ